MHARSKIEKIDSPRQFTVCTTWADTGGGGGGGGGGDIGFVGSQPMLLLLHQYLGKHQKAIT